MVGALVACALALGVLGGAAIAPAPPSSLASEDSTVLTRLLALLAAQGGSRPAATATTAAAAAVPKPASTATAAAKPTPAPATAAKTPSSSTPDESSSESSGSEKSPGKKKPVRLPPISHVWLVVLGGGTGFAAVTAAPTTYPYLSGTLLKQGDLLERYSAIEAYELAGDAALLTGAVGESVSTISQPAEEPAESADAFLRRALAPILASSAYGENGLIVVTFGSAAQEGDPPTLSLTTLNATPPAGALLLSTALKAGHSPEAFNSLAPRQSLEAIFAAA